MQEQEALARLKRGDIRGLEALVARYQQPALRAAVVVCRDPALAEDLVQAAFVRVYERIDQYDPARPFGPWFIRSVVNDALKAVTRQRQVPLDPGAWAAIRAPAGESPEALVEAAETRDALWAVLDRLAPGQRAAVVLRYYAGLSDAEVAARLQVPPGTVRRRLHDARRRLRDLIPAWLRPPATSR